MLKLACPCQEISIPDQYTARAARLQYNAEVQTVSGTTRASDGDWAGELTTESRIIEVIQAQTGRRPDQAAWSKLQHGTEWRAADADHHGLLGEADAIITTVPNLAIATRTADCVPVFLTGARTIALVHAGMAGVAQEILPKIVRVLTEQFDESLAERTGTVGPFICKKCYTLSPRNEELLANYPKTQPFIVDQSGARTFDLAAGLTAQAETLGVGSWDAAAPCTHHDEDLFSSRHGHAERLLSYLMMVPDDA
jgi:YfiH family protein